MPKRYKLTITNPCSEPWSEMTPSEQGRFCAYCAKNVVDFTLMSDSPIAQYLQDTFILTTLTPMLSKSIDHEFWLNPYY